MISLASNGDYLVFKTAFDPFIYVMTICNTNFWYNSNTFTCEECLRNNKTFGIQDNTCLLCADLSYAYNNANAVLSA